MLVAARLAPFLFLVGAFAGCANAPSEPPPSVPLETSVAPAKQATLLRVLVITDEYLPVAGATVAVVGLGNASTDEVGNAYFQIGTPGRYSLHVHHPRFYPNVSKVVVDGGPSQVERITLRDAPSHQHYSSFYFFQGLCGPAASVPEATSDRCDEAVFSNRAHPRWFLNEGLTDAYFRLDWPAQLPGADEMWIEVGFPDAGAFRGGSQTLRAQGEAPVVLEIPEEEVTEPMKRNGVPIWIRVGIGSSLPVAANVYQEFSIEAQLDYYIPEPDVDPEA